MAEHDDSDIARVLRAAGERANPSPELTQSVYESVHAEWRATVAKQGQRRRTQRTWFAAAASILVVAITLFFMRDMWAPQGAIVANVSRTVGVVQIQDAKSGEWRHLDGTRALRAGERVHTGANGRISIFMSDGVSVRLDRYTNITLASADRIDVSEGAVYVDSGTSTATAGRLLVGTPMGTLRHVGTQYEARLLHGGGTRIRVREGRVDATPVRGDARTLEVGDQAVMMRRAVQNGGRIEPNSDEWDWVSSAAPEFNIDGRPLHEFLTWAARETGLRIVFATPESADEARRAMLSGSVSGLTPDEALAAVLPTTSLRSSERDGQLVIEMAAR